MRDEKGLGGYGIKEEFAHAKSATAAMGAENVSTLCRMSKCGGGVDGACHGGCDGVDVGFGGYGVGG